MISFWSFYLVSIKKIKLEHFPWWVLFQNFWNWICYKEKKTVTCHILIRRHFKIKEKRTLKEVVMILYTGSFSRRIKVLPKGKSKPKGPCLLYFGNWIILFRGSESWPVTISTMCQFKVVVFLQVYMPSLNSHENDLN